MMTKHEGLCTNPEVHFAALEKQWVFNVLLHHSVPARRLSVAHHQLGRVCQAHICAARPLRQLHHPVVVLPSVLPLQHAHMPPFML